MKNLVVFLVVLVTAPFCLATSADAPYPSTYARHQAQTVLIRHANIYTGTGEIMLDTDVLVRTGKIAKIGQGLPVSDDVLVYEAAQRWLTPGLIDVHSHAGVYPLPSVEAHNDGNEMTAPVTPEVWAEHSVWPQDPNFTNARAGGVTTLQILPGSGNLIGGRSVTLKNVDSRTVQGMKFPGAPYGLKMACGENPKRIYGDRKQAPMTRMGNVAGYRSAWIKATEYAAKWDRFEASKEKDAVPPERDLGLETLVGVLKGEILVHNHCYRADEMATMLDVAREFGYKITAFHHAIEAYKIRDLLAENQVCAAMWADLWGFKMEAFDTIPENVALVHDAGVCAIVHSDSDEGIQRLNQEAAKSMAAGRRAGIKIPPEQAIMWLTINPARALGIDQVTGSIEVGKMADLVIWNREPFSVYALADQVFIDGLLVHDRLQPSATPVSDFILGLEPAEAANSGGHSE